MSIELRDLFLELATLVESGISVQEAWQRSRFSARYPQVLSKLNRGESLSHALETAEIVSRGDVAMIRASETSGQLSRALKQLALQSEQRQRFLQQLKARLVLLYAVVAIAAFAGGVLYVMRGTGDLAAYFLMSGVKLVVFYFLIKRLLTLLAKDAAWWCSICWPLGLMKAKSPQLLFSVAWFKVFAWQLQSGLDAVAAVRSLKPMLSNSTYQAAVDRATQQLEMGQPIAQSLMASGLVFHASLKAALISGEGSGSLVSSLDHQVALLEQELQLKRKELLVWLPGVLYGATLLFALSFI